MTLNPFKIIRGAYRLVKKVIKAIIDFLRKISPFKRNKPADSGQQQTQKDQDQEQKKEEVDADPEDGRYLVRNEEEKHLMQSDSLEQALQSWQEETRQEGSIIDLETGLDITPEKSDDGRFVVLDKSGEQVGTYSEFNPAEQAWDYITKREGSIIDTQEKKDVTPYSGYLTDAEVNAINAVIANGRRGVRDFISSNGFRIDPDLVQRCVRAISKTEMPIFQLGNVMGDSLLPTKKVTITKRSSQVVEKPVEVWVDVPLEDTQSTWEDSVTPENDAELQMLDDISQITRVDPLALVAPTFEHDLAQGNLRYRQFQAEEDGPVPTVRMKQIVMQEEIIPHEWEEEIEVSDEARDQFLVVVTDLSGSMQGDRIHLAIATVAALVGKHLNDSSLYYHAWFANKVDRFTEGDSKKKKEALIKDVLKASARKNIGGGTHIQLAVHQAARKIRQMKRQGDIPEMLLITDGSDHVTAEDIYREIGSDVLLHTIVINHSNPSLKQHSTTYYELRGSSLGVRGLTEPTYSTYW